jgi:hypothetical protein
MGRQKKELRIAAFLPEGHRETRGRAPDLAGLRRKLNSLEGL